MHAGERNCKRRRQERPDAACRAAEFGLPFVCVPGFVRGGSSGPVLGRMGHLTHTTAMCTLSSAFVWSTATDVAVTHLALDQSFLIQGIQCGLLLLVETPLALWQGWLSATPSTRIPSSSSLPRSPRPALPRNARLRLSLEAAVSHICLDPACRHPRPRDPAIPISGERRKSRTGSPFADFSPSNRFSAPFFSTGGGNKVVLTGLWISRRRRKAQDRRGRGIICTSPWQPSFLGPKRTRFGHGRSCRGGGGSCRRPRQHHRALWLPDGEIFRPHQSLCHYLAGWRFMTCKIPASLPHVEPAY